MNCMGGVLTEVRTDRICIACQDSPGLWEKPLKNPSPNQQFFLLFSKLLRYYETAYAAVISRQEAFFDNKMPMEVLGHNPWEDPLEAIFDRILKKGDFNLQDEAKNTKIQQLK